MEINLLPRFSRHSSVERLPKGWKLMIPSGESGTYRLAQLDDYARLPRALFCHAPPVTLNLTARASSANLPGTWGFGFWNDPLSFSLGFGNSSARLPVLPNTAWFFHASSQNWLSIHEGLPGNGFFAGTFRSPRYLSILSALMLPVIPWMAVRLVSRFFRKWAGKLVHQDSTAIQVDVTERHRYSIQWLRETCLFKIDGETILCTSTSPMPPLGLVLWIDNQFAAWSQDGKVRFGTLSNLPAWLEIVDLEMIA
jgi:hypothetical protein